MQYMKKGGGLKKYVKTGTKMGKKRKKENSKNFQQYAIYLDCDDQFQRIRYHLKLRKCSNRIYVELRLAIICKVHLLACYITNMPHATIISSSHNQWHLNLQVFIFQYFMADLQEETMDLTKDPLLNVEGLSDQTLGEVCSQLLY